MLQPKSDPWLVSLIHIENVTATTTGDPSFLNFYTNVDAIYRTQNIM